MDFWARLGGVGLTWSGLAAALIALVAALFLRRLLPAERESRGKASVALLVVAPPLHFVATGVGFLGHPKTAALLHLVDLLVVALGITGTASLLVFDVLLSRTRVPTIARDIVQVLAFLLVFFGVLQVGGIDPLSLLTTSAVLTAVVGLALQNIMANLLAGLALQIDRTFVTGDTIQVGSRVGKIEEIRWRATAIRTPSGDLLLIPNASLLSTEVVNLSRPTAGHLAGFTVPFHHRHSPGEVEAVVLGAVAKVPGVLADPPPSCAPSEFERGRILYRVSFGVDVALEAKVGAEVKTRLWYAARRAGLAGPCSSAATEGLDLADRVAALAKVAVLAPLDPAERERIARDLREQIFARGERLLGQGDPGDSLYVIAHGEVIVEVEGGGARREIARLGPGEVIGEMSWLTGAPRAATCTAAGEVRTYLVDHALARRVLADRPALAADIAAELARRLSALEGQRAHLAAAAEARAPDARADLLARIKAYFRLA
jgi:small-conductance mechanosensitive channel/CRP-like cAMP-binding protein